MIDYFSGLTSTGKRRNDDSIDLFFLDEFAEFFGLLFAFFIKGDVGLSLHNVFFVPISLSVADMAGLLWVGL